MFRDTYSRVEKGNLSYYNFIYYFIVKYFIIVYFQFCASEDRWQGQTDRSEPSPDEMGTEAKHAVEQGPAIIMKLRHRYTGDVIDTLVTSYARSWRHANDVICMLVASYFIADVTRTLLT